MNKTFMNLGQYNNRHVIKHVTLKSIFYVCETNFLNKSKIPILVSDSAHKSLLIILITFFNQTKIKKVTVCLNFKKVNI